MGENSSDVKLVNACLGKYMNSSKSISASTVATITSVALGLLDRPDLIKSFVNAVLLFLRDSAACQKLSGLYVVDSVCRAVVAASRRKQIQDVAVFSTAFARALPSVSSSIRQAPESDKHKIKRLLNLWRESKLFPSSFLDKADEKWIGTDIPSNPPAALPDFAAAAQLLSSFNNNSIPIPQSSSFVKDSFLDKTVAQNLLNLVSKGDSDNYRSSRTRKHSSDSRTRSSKESRRDFRSSTAFSSRGSRSYSRHSRSEKDVYIKKPVRTLATGPWVQTNGGCNSNEIKVLSRTLVAFGFTKPLSEMLIMDLFGPHGLIESVDLNHEDKSAKFRFRTRKMAQEAKEMMDSKETHAGLLKVNWKCSFGPEEYFQLQSGYSILELNSLSKYEVDCLQFARAGGIREGDFAGGITVEEPTIAQE